MGAWGLRLFESDHDWDRLAEMEEEAGIDALQAEAKKRYNERQQQEARSSRESEGNTAGTGIATGDTTAPEDDEVYQFPDDERFPLALFGSICLEIDLVREHLESGVLLQLINSKKAKMHAASEKYRLSAQDQTAVFIEQERDMAVYEFVLLGACARYDI